MLTVKIVKLRHQIREAECVIVMSPSHRLTPFVKPFAEKVILDAGWPLSDSNFTRDRKRISILRPLLNLIIDFVSMHCADLVVLETQNQMSRVSRKFQLKLKKLSFRFSGVTEENFTSQDPVLPFEVESINLKGKKVVLFRGKTNIESGLETLAAASWNLPDDIFLIVVSDKRIKSRFNPRNSIELYRFLKYSELVAIYQISDLAIGQISDFERVDWTIPHKAFEAAFFSIPYLSRKNNGLLEFLNSESAIYLDEISVLSLAKKIQESLSDTSLLSTYAESIHDSYIRFASYTALSQQYKLALKQISINEY